VVGSLGRRAVEAVVALFALLGFFFVPLGRHTGFEHAKAVFSTPAATQALRELAQAVVGLRSRILGEATPNPEPKEARGRPARSEPKPTPPRLN
jgi:hypothetical protein